MKEHPDEWEELTEKEILLGVLTELQQIRLTLQSTEPQDTIETYSCGKCGWKGSKEDMETHAKNEHNAPKGMLNELFTQEEA